MRNPRLILFVGVWSVLSVCPGLHATIYPNPLASRTLVMTGGTATTPSTFGFILSKGFGFGYTSPLFETMSFTAANAGQTFFITQAQDPDFNGFVSILQNGQSDSIDFELHFNGSPSVAYGIASQESLFFAPLPAGNNGIDFLGFPIDNIALRLDSVNIGVSSYSITATIFVDSAAGVPEPSVGALAGLGGFLCLLARKKSR
jgi:hypothetical protein